MQQQDINKRIAKNTFFLYVRMLLTILVSLYSSRIVLQVLGASDYGLYNVIGGILTMFGMLSSALTVGTQRFLTYALGENNIVKLKEIFSMSLLLHVILSIIIFIFSETIGLWFLKHVMYIFFHPIHVIRKNIKYRIFYMIFHIFNSFIIIFRTTYALSLIHISEPTRRS